VQCRNHGSNNGVINWTYDGKARTFFLETTRYNLRQATRSEQLRKESYVHMNSYLGLLN
jgi:hypothetical protein